MRLQTPALIRLRSIGLFLFPIMVITVSIAFAVDSQTGAISKSINFGKGVTRKILFSSSPAEFPSASVITYRLELSRKELAPIVCSKLPCTIDLELRDLGKSQSNKRTNSFISLLDQNINDIDQIKVNCDDEKSVQILNENHWRFLLSDVETNGTCRLTYSTKISKKRVAPSKRVSRTPHKKKFIHWGWDIPDSRYIRKNWHEMEKMPFDGMIAEIPLDRSNPDTTYHNRLSWRLTSNKRFNFEDFKESIQDLKVPRWTRTPDIFLGIIMSWNSGSYLNWWNDSDWETVVHNWKLYARIAKQSGSKGLLIDTEHYFDSKKMFNFESMQNLDRSQPSIPQNRTIEDYKKIVQRRAASLMAAINEEFPDATLFFSYASSMAFDSWGSDMDLLPAFLDGFLEKAAPGISIVDGRERGYSGYTEDWLGNNGTHRKQFNTAQSKSKFPALYKKHMQLGLGTWLDSGFIDGKWAPGTWSEDDQSDYVTPAQLYDRLVQFCNTSDQYVFIYHEIPRFYPLSKVPTAYLEAMERAQNDCN